MSRKIEKDETRASRGTKISPKLMFKISHSKIPSKYSYKKNHIMKYFLKNMADYSIHKFSTDDSRFYFSKALSHYSYIWCNERNNDIVPILKNLNIKYHKISFIDKIFINLTHILKCNGGMGRILTEDLIILKLYL